MVLADIDQEMMAKCLGIGRSTLKKHYRRELDTSYAIVKSEIAAKLITKARNGDFQAARYYLSTHGWVESERLVVADGGVDDSDIRALSDEALEKRRQQLLAQQSRRKRKT